MTYLEDIGREIEMLRMKIRTSQAHIRRHRERIKFLQDQKRLFRGDPTSMNVPIEPEVGPDHILYNYSENPPFLHCCSCEEKLYLTFPIRASLISDIIDLFIQHHRDCPAEDDRV